jgi:ribosomal protein S18 acetylase RimI-like enzyme
MNITPPIIRQATESDYEQLCDLFEELDALHRQARPDLFRKQQGAPRERSYVASLIAGPDSTVLVAGDRGSRSLYGFATLILRVTPENGVRAERRIVEIDNLAVRRDWRRMGLGRLLISEVDKWAARSNLGTVELAVHEFNADAILFYEAVGFSTSQRRMSRELAAQD